MRKITIMSLVGIILLALAAGALSEEAAFAPGLSRVPAGRRFEQARVLAEQRGVGLTDGLPLYEPGAPQPLNAFMVTAEDCQVGIDGDDMYPVADTGLIPQITDCLERWCTAVEDQSRGLIRFVADPGHADILVMVRQSYKLYGRYSGGGKSAEGYACTVTFTAVQLTDPRNRCTLSDTRKPGETVTLRGGERFWKTPPAFEESGKLWTMIQSILEWYGLGAEKGDKGGGVKALQQKLKERGYLKDAADGDFGSRTQAAVMALQQDYGLEPTGIVDASTLLACCYDRTEVAAFREMP
ncbi:MAG: peptidoglycan-binding protein [Clostridia bacterium]|nr:peptidoglycan-binding protein [Clostridia bacterium]